MSFKDAQLAARKLAEDFLANAKSNGFDGVLQEPRPDQQAESLGKVCRYWMVTVEWRKNDRGMEGPSIIQADLLEQVAMWHT